jgi:hypothetical protein
MAAKRCLFAICIALAAGAARAQVVVDEREMLDADRPEAWAMNTMSAATLLTPAGASPALAPGQWQLSLDAAQVPRLNERQRRVGFEGYKLEDLNRSPLFGRLRGAIGLPWGFVAELGYTPPLRVDGVRLEQMWAGAISRRLWSRGDWSFSGRVFGQHGYAQGDITCPRHAVGSGDPDQDPFDCFEPSRDRAALHHYGFDLGAAYAHGPWEWSFNAGGLRFETEVQVDALILGGAVRDRTRLVSRDRQPLFVLGLRRALGPRWQLGAEVLHVPLQVRRSPTAVADSDAMTSLRLQLRWTPAPRG